VAKPKAHRRDKRGAVRGLSAKEKANLIVTAAVAIAIHGLAFFVLFSSKTRLVYGTVIDVDHAANAFSMSATGQAAPIHVSLRHTSFDINRLGFMSGAHVHVLFRNSLLGPKQAVSIELLDRSPTYPFSGSANE
jgi:hypothetical protein